VGNESLIAKQEKIIEEKKELNDSSRMRALIVQQKHSNIANHSSIASKGSQEVSYNPFIYNPSAKTPKAF